MFEDGRETMIGEARYVIDERDPATCEFAIADRLAGCGIGRALLDRLGHQVAAAGIQHMVANSAMIGLATRAGYTVRANREDATLARLEKKLDPLAAPPSVHPLAARASNHNTSCSNQALHESPWHQARIGRSRRSRSAAEE